MTQPPPLEGKYHINPAFNDWDSALLPEPYASDLRPKPSYKRLNPIRVALCGLTGCGRRSFLSRLGPIQHRPFAPGEVSMEIISGPVTDQTGDVTVSMEIRSWAVGIESLEQSFRSEWRKLWSESHVIIWMVDASDEGRLDMRENRAPTTPIRTSRSEFDKMIAEPTVRGKPILVLCNKIDLPGAVDLFSCHRRMGLPFPVVKEGWSNAAITRDRLLPVVNDCLASAISIAPIRVLITEYALGSREDLQSGFVRCEPIISTELFSRSPTTITDPQLVVQSLIPAVYLRSGLAYPPTRSICTLM